MHLEMTAANAEEMNPYRTPDWANQELQQWTNQATDFTVGWFCLSDQSGISGHLMESMRYLNLLEFHHAILQSLILF